MNAEIVDVLDELRQTLGLFAFAGLSATGSGMTTLGLLALRAIALGRPLESLLTVRAAQHALWLTCVGTPTLALFATLLFTTPSSTGLWSALPLILRSTAIVNIPIVTGLVAWGLWADRQARPSL